jgi:D-glycero-alpha-D-manno-heptose-7-phosphate kinase
MQDLPSGISLKKKNKKILVKAPTRVDLSGGTLDIWPLFCFYENSKTINLAIDGFVEVKIGFLNSNFFIKEKGRIFEFKDLKKIEDSPFKLYSLVFSYFNLKGIEVEILNMPPKFSGLGGSSSLLICLLKGIFFLLEKKVSNSFLINLGRDLEAKNMGFPTGTQDFYPPLYGGALCINYNLGKENFERLNGIKEIKKHIIIYNTLVEHHSGIQNFDVFKKAIEKKDGSVWKNLKEIAKITNEMYKFFRKKDFKKVGSFMREEWDLRKNLSAEFNHPEIDKAVEVAKRCGAWGWKPCGAAGGGSIVFFVSEQAKETLTYNLNLLKGDVLPYNITRKGLNLNYVGW